MGKIIEASNLPDSEKIYLNQDIFGQWKVVYPLKNEDGSWNWKNIITGGNKWNFIMLIIFVLIAVGLFFEYSSNLEFCKSLLQTQV